MTTRGGVASFVREMRETPLWTEWDVRHVTTHRDGTALTKIAIAARALVVYLYQVLAHRPAVVHLHMSSYGSFVRKYVFELIARGLRIPVVLHLHGSDFRLFHDRGPRLLRAAIRDALRGAAVVVALGEPWAQALRGITAEARIIVVCNAVRLAEPVDQRTEQPVRVLFLGEIGERKGAFTLLDAWQRMVRAAGDPAAARLLVAGDGAVEAARKRIADLGVESTVEIRGWVAAQQVPEVMRRAHVLVLPSHREGQPMAILEAMARGLCVVTCPVGGIPDLVGEDCGVLVPPGEIEPLATALEQVVLDGALRARLGAAAWQRVRDEFDIDVVWRRFDRIYREVIDEHR
ncbi:glycosyltransferase [Nocardia sp. 2]|uniref:Glycosyltransferase n=1 Tax=Nocardia acididurans TaxID=2802282 RepID=A0ABS1M0N9_9NOCA|nr:glycosyltransferase [Nocardia acididurans]MBL1074071.1 glycosyltransferase [Nocardia acididurans]